MAGHDRGGRCAYRLALDHPERVPKLAVLDIMPTGEHFRRTDMDFGLGYWHWFFLAQPYRSARAADRRRSGRFFWSRLRHAAEPRRLRPEAWRTTCAASATRRRSTRCARTIAPAPRSTTSSTRPIAARGASPARCWRCGAGAALEQVVRRARRVARLGRRRARPGRRLRPLPRRGSAGRNIRRACPRSSCAEPGRNRRPKPLCLISQSAGTARAMPDPRMEART